jgi:hypothetical protein
MPMSPWMETAGIVAVIAAGILCGRVCTRWPGRWWMTGYFVPLALVLAVGVGRREAELAFSPTFRWLNQGRTGFVLLAAALPALTATLLPHVTRPRERVLLSIFMGLVVTHYVVMPFAQPAWNSAHFARMKTMIDAEGVCHQNEPYTCGPAAAVTALRRMGLAAEEGELAILSRTSSAAGTPADFLCTAIEERYGKDGVRADFRLFGSAAELERQGEVLAVIKWGFLVDHFVAVLALEPGHVVLGDPLKGKRRVTRAEFDQIWRKTAVVLRRT